MKRLILLLFLLTDFRTLQAQTSIVTVSSGKTSRINSVVSFKLSPEFAKRQVFLEDKAGNKFPLQIDLEGKAFAILDLSAEQTKTYRVVKAGKLPQGVSIEKSEAEIKFLSAGKQIIGFQTGKRTLPVGVDSIFLRGGYIHPVLSPSGLQVSDDYPLNHKHHHGVWSAWTKTEFESRHPDFWNMGDKTGTVILEGISEAKEGPVFGSLKSRNIYLDKTVTPHKKVLSEDWEVKVYNFSNQSKSYFMFDIDLKQQCTSQSALKLLEHLYGGIGFRGNKLWEGEKNTFFLTSEGKDRINGHSTRANWCYVGGSVSGTQTGIAILSHPRNFRSPQPMRIHPTEPFFCFAPSQAGNFEIKPGNIFQARYRFIVFDGKPDAEFINSLWKDYADPIRATVKL